MAIAATSLTSGSDGTDATTYTTASITPTANRLVLVAVVSRHNGSDSTPTITGYTQIDSIQEVNGVARLTLFRRLSASPPSGALSIVFGTEQRRCAWSVVEFSGVDTSGTNGAGAIAQVQSLQGTTPFTSLAITLGAFSSLANATYGALMVAFATGEAITHGSGFTELHEVLAETFTAVDTQFRADNDTTVDWSWTSSAGNAGIALELKAEPPPPPPATLLGQGGSPDVLTTLDTDVLSPSADSLVLLAVGSRDVDSITPLTPTVSGATNAWTQVGTATLGPVRVTLFRHLSASPASEVATITFTGNQTDISWIATEWPDVDTGGTNGADAIVQVATDSEGAGTPLSIALSAFADAVNNSAYGTIVEQSGGQIAPGLGFTELGDLGPLALGLGIGHEDQGKPGEDTSVEWPSTSGNRVGVAVEIAAASAEAPSATGAPALSGLAAAGSAIQKQAASGAADLSQLTALGASTHRLSAAGAASLSELTAAGVGSERQAATGAPALSELTAVGAATQAQSASGAPALSELTAAGVGAGDYVATGAVTLAELVAEGSGRAAQSATGAPALSELTAAAAAAHEQIAAGAPTLGELAASGAGAADYVGAGAGALAEMTAAAVGAQTQAASGAPTLDGLAAAGAAAHEQSATGAPTLGELAAAGTGAAGDTPIASGDPALAELQAAGSATQQPEATGAGTLAELVALGASVLEQSASGTPALSEATAVGAAAVEQAASGAASLGGLTASGAGAHAQAASGAPALPPLGAAGTATVALTTFTGSGAVRLEELTVAGAGATDVTAAGAPSLPGLAASGVAVAPITSRPPAPVAGGGGGRPRRTYGYVGPRPYVQPEPQPAPPPPPEPVTAAGGASLGGLGAAGGAMLDWIIALPLAPYVPPPLPPQPAGAAAVSLGGFAADGEAAVLEPAPGPPPPLTPAGRKLRNDELLTLIDGRRARVEFDAVLNDPAVWEAFRLAVVRRARPMFREAFMIGAALGARERPTSAKEGISALGALTARLAPEITLAGLFGMKADIPGIGPGGMPLPDESGLVSLPFDYDEIARATDQVIDEYTDDWWRTVEASTRERMRVILRQAANEGLTIPQVTRALEPLFGQARAARIAVAETTNLLGMGAQETYRRAGFDGWIWRTARDSLVDPVCEQLGRESDPRRGGRAFPMTRRFQRAHIGCRCWPVPAGQPTAQRILAANPVIPTQFRPA